MYKDDIKQSLKEMFKNDEIRLEIEGNYWEQEKRLNVYIDDEKVYSTFAYSTKLDNLEDM